MRRNTKFAGHLVKRFDWTHAAYVGCVVREKRLTAKKHLITMQRIRDILEFRYNTIV